MLNLGEVIQTLRHLDSELMLAYPQELISWRGRYDELSMQFDPDVTSQTVDALLAICTRANGAEFTGYKGGEHTMNLSTPVWADPYGDCNGWAAEGFYVRDGLLFVATSKIDPCWWKS